MHLRRRRYCSGLLLVLHNAGSIGFCLVSARLKVKAPLLGSTDCGRPEGQCLHGPAQPTLAVRTGADMLEQGAPQSRSTSATRCWLLHLRLCHRHNKHLAGRRWRGKGGWSYCRAKQVVLQGQVGWSQACIPVSKLCDLPSQQEESSHGHFGPGLRLLSELKKGVLAVMHWLLCLLLYHIGSSLQAWHLARPGSLANTTHVLQVRRGPD